MGRSGGCGLCPPAKHRHRTRQHRDNPVQWCTGCHGHVCERHIEWHNGWWCTRCVRADRHRQDGATSPLTENGRQVG